jgi:hypothetical protein
MADDFAVWVYAVTDQPDHDLTATTGVARERLGTVEGAGLVAVVGSVSLAEFGAEPLRRKLEDLAALDGLARAHHNGVAAVARTAAVVPARLASVYRDDTRVAGMLGERGPDFRDTLRRLAGRTEWGIKVYGAANPPTASTGAPPAGTEARPGTAYLMRRRTELRAAEDAREVALAAAEKVHATLGRFAVASRQHPPQDRQLTGDAGWMVLNGAYLVADDRTDDFAAAVRSLADRYPAVRLESTGPWPPYSFAAPLAAGRS